MEKFDPNRKVSIVYLCAKTGHGMTVDPDSGPTIEQEAMAMAYVCGCEEAGGCPPDCEMRMLVPNHDQEN